MIIIGAKGFAKELLEIFHRQGQLQGLAFYDDVNLPGAEPLFGQFPVLTSEAAARSHFEHEGNLFTIGIGNPILRKLVASRFAGWGGVLSSVVSPESHIGSYGVSIGQGCNILPGVMISNDVTIGDGCLLYYNVVVTHDCRIGDFVELSPGVTLLGRCKIGSFTQIGAGSVVLPDVTIGENVVIGAGALVTRDVPDNAVAYGHPAKIIRMSEPIHFTP